MTKIVNLRDPTPRDFYIHVHDSDALFFKTSYWQPDDILLRPKHVAVLEQMRTVVYNGILKSLIAKLNAHSIRWAIPIH
jgi:hypothetical protein